jgi:mannose-1-phosphate guanylyltransferase
MKALLLTAGLGTRLRPITNHWAKPAIPFINQPLMIHGLQWLADLGTSDITCNLHYLPETVKAAAQAALKASPEFDGKLHFSDETVEILGSGGAIFHARSTLQGQGSFVYLNGDEVILPSSPHVPAKMRATHEANDAFATILVKRHPDAGITFGAVLADDSGRVVGFQKPPVPENFGHLHRYHFTGLQIISDRVFKYQRPGVSNIFYDIFREAIAAGEKVMVFEDNCHWFETGNEADMVAATGEVLQLLMQKTSPLSPRDTSTIKPSQVMSPQASTSTSTSTSTIDSNMATAAQWLRTSFSRFSTHPLNPVRTTGGGIIVLGKNSRVNGTTDIKSLNVKGFLVVGDAVDLQVSGPVENVIVLNSTPGHVVKSVAQVTNKIIV